MADGFSPTGLVRSDLVMARLFGTVVWQGRGTIVQAVDKFAMLPGLEELTTENRPEIPLAREKEFVIQGGMNIGAKLPTKGWLYAISERYLALDTKKLRTEVEDEGPIQDYTQDLQEAEGSKIGGGRLAGDSVELEEAGVSGSPDAELGFREKGTLFISKIYNRELNSFG
ncbi:hypothetical protein TWF281_004209 [Arthrobotrys megalospora]